MKKTALVVLAQGFEEIEAVTPVDVLRRADLKVTVAAVGPKKSVMGAHGIRIETDVLLEDYQGVPDIVVLPGGMPGAENLGKSKTLSGLLSNMQKEGRWIAAICAAPALVLAPAGLLEGKKSTCYPGYEGELEAGKAVFSDSRVVVDGRVITSRGPGTALEFSLEIVKQLGEALKAESLRNGMLSTG